MNEKQWLGEENTLGLNIWRNKYQFENETFEEWLNRVSGGNEDIKDMIKNKRFLFGGRILANRGLEKKGKKVTLSNCFKEGMKVITRRGLINIEDIQIGDFVITEDGSWQMVNNVMSRDYEGDIFKISGASLYDNIYCTPNHQFLTQEGWIRADRLSWKMPHRLKTPNLIFEKKYEDIDLYNVISKDDETEIRDKNGKIKLYSNYIKIDSIEILENQSCKVYNLSVENVHSYTVNGVIVHNCYVIPEVEDSIESIYDTCSKLARTFSYSGGVGVDISKLRPKGMKVNNASEETTGACSFMDTFSQVTATIGQNGRRG